MGRVTYEGKVKHPFAAHPKIDPETGKHVAPIMLLRENWCLLHPACIQLMQLCWSCCYRAGIGCVVCLATSRIALTAWSAFDTPQVTLR